MEELEKYLEQNGFDKVNYATEITNPPLYYWHHEKCADILQLYEGKIYVCSLPKKIFEQNLVFASDLLGEYIETKTQVDILVNALKQL